MPMMIVFGPQTEVLKKAISELSEKFSGGLQVRQFVELEPLHDFLRDERANDDYIGTIMDSGVPDAIETWHQIESWLTKYAIQHALFSYHMKKDLMESFVNIGVIETRNKAKLPIERRHLNRDAGRSLTSSQRARLAKPAHRAPIRRRP